MDHGHPCIPVIKTPKINTAVDLRIFLDGQAEPSGSEAPFSAPCFHGRGGPARAGRRITAVFHSQYPARTVQQANRRFLRAAESDTFPSLMKDRVGKLCQHGGGGLLYIGVKRVAVRIHSHDRREFLNIKMPHCLG